MLRSAGEGVGGNRNRKLDRLDYNHRLVHDQCCNANFSFDSWDVTYFYGRDCQFGGNGELHEYQPLFDRHGTGRKLLCRVQPHGQRRELLTLWALCRFGLYSSLDDRRL